MSKVSHVPSLSFLHELHSPHCQGTSHDRDVMMSKISKALGVTDLHMIKLEFKKRLFYCPHNFHQHNSPLMSALSAKHYTCTKFFLNLGMNPNEYILVILMNGNNLFPPLQILLDMPFKDYSLIELLLRSGAHPDTTLNLGLIPLNCLSYACLIGDYALLELFLKYGASIILYTWSIFGTLGNLQHEICFDSSTFCAKRGNAIGLLMLFLKGAALDCQGRFDEMNKICSENNIVPQQNSKPALLLHNILIERDLPLQLPYEGKINYEKCLEILREGGVSFWEKDVDGKMLVDLDCYKDVERDNPRLHKYVRESMSNPLRLKSLARIRIKKLLNGRDYLQKIEMLKLSRSLVDYLAFADLVPRTLTYM